MTSARSLAAIVFTDIVGYSAIVHKDEALGAKLLDRQRVVVRRIVPQHGGREVETAGDSFLLEFGSALAAVQAVVSIQQALASDAGQPRVVLRASVHLGDVEHRGHEVFGDGVNIAARLLPHSPEGGLAVSAPVLGLITQRMELPARSIGSPSLKNISRPVEIFVVEADQLRELQMLKAEISPTSKAPGWMAGIMVTLAGIVILAAFLAWWRHTTGPSNASLVEKSVAALPFASLSADKENEYIADGVQDAIITNLAHVKDLKVISRTSVMEYRDPSRNLKEIADQLHVGNVVEGSVQKAGSRLRVTAQLISAANDQHLWAETYDRDAADIFAIQSDVAREVVSAVSAQLTADEKARIETRPTNNAEAYDFYTRAKAIYWDDLTATSQKRIDQLLTRALELDPRFAPAHALLAANHAAMYWYGLDSRPLRLELAQKETEVALAIDPNLAEAHLSEGLYWYWGVMNFEKAQAAFDAALRAQPGYADAYVMKGAAYRREGKMEMALAALRKALELDPRNLANAINYCEVLWASRSYAEADAAFTQALAVSPDSAEGVTERGLFQTYWKGSFEILEGVLNDLTNAPDPDFIITRAKAQLSEWRGQYAQAVQQLTLLPESVTLEGVGRLPRDLLIGRELTFMGQPDKARPYFARARTWLQDHSDQTFAWTQHLRLGLIDAYLGDPAHAKTEFALARKLNPNPVDPVLRNEFQFVLAEGYLLVGDAEQALEEIREGVQPPSLVNGNTVKWSPAFAPLRADPRFEELVRDNTPR